MSAGEIAEKVRSVQKRFEPLDHYDYGELDLLCTCELCAEWRLRLSLLQDVQKRIEQKICTNSSCAKDMKGRCDDCRVGIKLRTSYLASLNRRDLYSECSFHAFHMEPRIVGKAFMAWVHNILADRGTRTDGWWVGKAPFLPIQYWLTMFRRSVATGTDATAGDDDLADFEHMPNTAIGSLVIAAAASSGAI